jgi:hypothetical protein
VQEHAIEAAGEGVFDGPLAGRGAQQPIGPGEAVGDVLGRIELGARPSVGLAEQLAQVVHADAARADDADDGDAERVLQFEEVHITAAGLELVDHRQDEQGREADTEDFGEERQAALEGRRVDDADDGVGLLFALHLAAEDLDCDGLVFADRVEAVGAGQVDEFDGAVAGEHAAGAALDGDAGVVAGLGAQAGEAVEEGRLARIGAADEGDSDGRCGGAGHAMRLWGSASRGGAEAGQTPTRWLGRGAAQCVWASSRIRTWMRAASVLRRQTCVPRKP